MKLAWLFPGQGAQEVGMGKDVYDVSPAARGVFEAADRALGSPLSPICFEGPAADLLLTANTQPAILTTSCALVAALREAHPALPQPVAAAGHSLGEYSALVAASALAFEDAVRLVRLRGEAMQEAVPAGQGAMVAVMGGDPETVQRLCDDARGDGVLSPANFNSPGQIVIAGDRAAAELAVELAKDRGLKAIPLKVSAPFHCALMAPAATRVAAALHELQVQPLQFPVVSNVEATPNQDPSRVADLLVRQVASAVQWEQSVRWLADQGVTHALEIGPGSVLAGLAKRITKDIKVLSVRDRSGVERVPEFLAN